MLAQLVALLVAPSLQVVPHPPGVTTMVSVGDAGAQSNGISINSSVSNDGRYVAFESLASDLVPGDTNNTSDVFLRDRLLGTTVRLSLTLGGVQVFKASRLPVISADGTKAVFVSESQFFAPGDTNMSADVVVRDLQSGTNAPASVNSDGKVGDQASGPADISADGRFVVFASHSDNLVPGDDNDVYDVFVRDMELGLTERVSVATDGTQGNDDSEDVSITPDAASSPSAAAPPTWWLTTSARRLTSSCATGCWAPRSWSAGRRTARRAIRTRSSPRCPPTAATWAS